MLQRKNYTIRKTKFDKTSALQFKQNEESSIVRLTDSKNTFIS